MAYSETQFELLTSLIHGWQRQCGRLPLQGFRHWALDQLRSVLPFDTAWWGRATFVDGQEATPVHDYFLFSLPDQYHSDWQTIASEDHIALALTAQPHVPVITGVTDPVMRQPLRDVLLRYDIHHVLCCTTQDPVVELNAQGSLATGQLVDFISLYRGADGPPFSQSEAHLLNNLLPNLAEALANCHRQMLERERSAATESAQPTLVLVDGDGYLLHADAAFYALMRERLTGWNGISVPTQWLTATGWQPALDADMVVSAEALGEQWLLTVRQRTAVDALTAREREVATLFASGATYRTIAEQLHRSPSTVRNHLQSIYLKLGVSTKAELVARMQT